MPHRATCQNLGTEASARGNQPVDVGRACTEKCHAPGHLLKRVAPVLGAHDRGGHRDVPLVVQCVGCHRCEVFDFAGVVDRDATAGFDRDRAAALVRGRDVCGDSLDAFVKGVACLFVESTDGALNERMLGNTNRTLPLNSDWCSERTLACDVSVVAARVHCALVGRSIVDVEVLVDGQGIQVAAQQGRGSGLAGVEFGYDWRRCFAGSYVEAQACQRVENSRLGSWQLEAEFGILVDGTA